MEKDLHCGTGYNLLLLFIVLLLNSAVELIAVWCAPTLELLKFQVWLCAKDELALSWRDCTEAGMNELALYEDLRLVASTWSNIASIAGLGSSIMPMLNYLSVALHRVNLPNELNDECEVGWWGEMVLWWGCRVIGTELRDNKSIELFGTPIALVELNRFV